MALLLAKKKKPKERKETRNLARLKFLFVIL